MPYNGHVLSDSLPYQFRIPDATKTQAGVMSPADKAKLASVGVCSMGANEDTYLGGGNLYRIGVNGRAAGTPAPFLIPQEVTPATLLIYVTTAPLADQLLHARCFYSPDQGATDNQLGELILLAGEKYKTLSLPGTVILPAGSYLLWVLNFEDGGGAPLTTAVSLSVG